MDALVACGGQPCSTAFFDKRVHEDQKIGARHREFWMANFDQWRQDLEPRLNVEIPKL